MTDAGQLNEISDGPPAVDQRDHPPLLDGQNDLAVRRVRLRAAHQRQIADGVGQIGPQFGTLLDDCEDVVDGGGVERPVIQLHRALEREGRTLLARQPAERLVGVLEADAGCGVCLTRGASERRRPCDGVAVVLPADRPHSVDVNRAGADHARGQTPEGADVEQRNADATVVQCDPRRGLDAVQLKHPR